VVAGEGGDAIDAHVLVAGYVHGRGRHRAGADDAALGVDLAVDERRVHRPPAQGMLAPERPRVGRGIVDLHLPPDDPPSAAEQVELPL
jgi:hypothetical protein